jgi:tetratricopeptide (TPR) repeat protein
MQSIDAETVEQWFADTQPKRSRLYGSYTFLLAALMGLMLVAVFGSRMGLPPLAGVLLAVLVLGLFMTTGWKNGRRQARNRHRVQQAWQAVQLDEWDTARSLLEDLVRRPIQSSTDRCEVFTLWAALAEEKGDYAAAARIYETLLLARIGDARQLQEAQIALASAKLRNQELTDAVEMIGRLEKVPMPQGMRAALDLVRLHQQVFMGNLEDAVYGANERRELYRRFLSTRAGYGYGLLAAAMHALGRTDEAKQLWQDATTLIKPDRLTSEYDVLAPVAQTYPPSEHPV